ncbi:MAG TPA: MFS transporter [Telluria sp.]|jgi:AAHS family 4-hydroxybenzoate transporter-like MFS transporter
MHNHDIDVHAFINRHPFSRYQWLVFALCFAIVLLDGFDTAAIGFIAPSLLREWGIGKPALAPVLSAALFGLAAGAIVAGPLADRLGRRMVLLGSVLVFGAGCGTSAFSAGLEQLVILRFVTGIGLGAAMPNAVTLMSEFCPDARRSFITNAMFCGFPLGAACGGFLAAWIIPQWGWRYVLAVGGIAPLVLLVVMVFALPESVRYMVAKSAPAARIGAVLRRIHPAAAGAPGFVMGQEGATTARGGIAVVFSPSYLVGTLMLWLAYFMGLVIFYALINWMPVLFREAGLPAQSATLISAVFPLGGVGAILSGWLMDRYNANRVIAIGFGLTAVAVFMIGQAVGNLGLLTAAVFLAGTLMNTAQSSLPALAAMYYPTQGRATGVAWMLGVGRFGGIAGSFLVAELARRELAVGQVFTVLAVAAVVSMLALAVKFLADRRTRL